MYDLCKGICLEMQKEKERKTLEQKKLKEQQGGFFRRLWGGGSSEVKSEAVLTEEDQNKIDEFFRENFKSDTLDVKKTKRPEEYVYCELQLNLKGVGVRLINLNPINRFRNEISFNFNGLEADLKMRENGQVNKTLFFFFFSRGKKKKLKNWRGRFSKYFLPLPSS